MFRSLIEDEVVSIETIDQQFNDSFVNNVTDMFTELRNLADKYSTTVVSSNGFFKNKETYSVIKSIDKLIYKRFGIKTSHVSATGIGYAVIPVPPANYNVVSGDMKEIFDSVKKELGKKGSKKEVKEGDVKDAGKAKIFDKDSQDIIYHIYKSYKGIEKSLKTEGVTIDLKKAKIGGLPSDYIVHLLVDYDNLINVNKLTSRELAAVLLHELGHAYNSIYYSYRTVKTTINLIDSLHETIRETGDAGKSLKLVYEKVLGGEEDLSKSNQLTAAVKVSNKYMTSMRRMSDNDFHSYTDNEQLADDFASRFGMGQELVTSLNKIMHPFSHKDRSTKEGKELHPSFIALMVLSAFAVLITLFIIAFLPLILFISLVSIVVDIIIGGSDSNEITYDTERRRYIRIKNTLISRLRTSKLSKKDTTIILDQLSTIETIIDNTRDGGSIGIRLGEKITPWLKQKAAFKKLEEYTEDLINNDLYQSSSRISQLI